MNIFKRYLAINITKAISKMSYIINVEWVSRTVQINPFMSWADTY